MSLEPRRDTKKKLTPKKTLRQWHEEFKIGKELLTKINVNSIMPLCILLMKRLWKRMRPRRFHVCGVVGFEDPCTTGRFIGMYEAVTCAADIRGNIDLRPDFEKPCLQLEAGIAGQFSIGVLLLQMVWFVFQRPVRRLIKLARIGSHLIQLIWFSIQSLDRKIIKLACSAIMKLSGRTKKGRGK
jgi:hypothetical protein